MIELFLCFTSLTFIHFVVIKSLFCSITIDVKQNK